MVCGYIGCGRYEEADALYHFEQSNHPVALNLEDNSIWSYTEDRFVNRVQGDHEPFQTSQDDGAGAQQVDDYELVALNSSVMLCEQLEVQRQFFEQKLAQVKEKCLIELAEGGDMILEEKFKQKEHYLARIDVLKQEKKLWKKEKARLNKRITNLKTKSSEVSLS